MQITYNLFFDKKITKTFKFLLILELSYIKLAKFLILTRKNLGLGFIPQFYELYY